MQPICVTLQAKCEIRLLVLSADRSLLEKKSTYLFDAMLLAEGAWGEMFARLR